jgi:hypothetical protein
MTGIGLPDRERSRNRDTEEAARILSEAVAGDENVVLGGPSSSGKTSLLYACVAETPPDCRVLGLIGYPVLLAGAVLAMFGVTDVQQGTGMLAMLPGGLFELILPIWLLAKGFSHPVVTGVKSSDPTDRAFIAALGQAAVTT